MEEGRKIITNDEHLKDPLKFTRALLDFKGEVDEIVRNAF